MLRSPFIEINISRITINLAISNRTIQILCWGFICIFSIIIIIISRKSPAGGPLRLHHRFFAQVPSSIRRRTALKHRLVNSTSCWLFYSCVFTRGFQYEYVACRNAKLGKHAGNFLQKETKGCSKCINGSVLRVKM